MITGLLRQGSVFKELIDYEGDPYVNRQFEGSMINVSLGF